MSGQKWPLGSEVRRKDLTGGVMLYDASRAGNATPAWFDPAYWQERNEIEGEARGRGTTHFVRAGKQHFVLRHYRRGGLMARLMGDRYFWRNESATRSFAEWQLLYHLHRAGLPVPAPIAARYRRQGFLYTADLITERMTDSISLAAALRRRGIPILGWITIGRCIRAFHDLGVCHPDLNAHNILLVGDDLVYLIDFDRGSLRKPGLWCDSNLVRLRRSLEKITYKLPPEHFSEADWQGLLDGYRQPGGMPGAPRKVVGASDASATGQNRVMSVAAESTPASASMPVGAAEAAPPAAAAGSVSLPAAREASGSASVSSGRELSGSASAPGAREASGSVSAPPAREASGSALGAAAREALASMAAPLAPAVGATMSASTSSSAPTGATTLEGAPQAIPQSAPTARR